MALGTTRSGTEIVLRDELASIAPAWDELVPTASLPTPFSRSWWLENVRRHRPRFLLVRDGSELVGGVALEERRLGGISAVTMLGSGPLCPDHLDLLARPGYDATVIDAVHRCFAGPGHRLIELDGLAEDAMLPRALPQARPTVMAVAPWLKVAGSEAYLAGRSANFRSNLRKVRNRANRERVRYRRLQTDELPQGLERLRALHRQRWGESRFLSAFDAFALAAQAGASAGAFSLHELSADGATIASVGCFEEGPRIFFYQAGRSIESRWRGAGTLLLFKVIEDAHERGLHEFDMLRGDERYKSAFADQQRLLLSTTMAFGVGGCALSIAGNLVRAAKRSGVRAIKGVDRRTRHIAGT